MDFSSRLDVLQIITSRFGQFWGTDNEILYRTRAMGAQLCVEVDLLEELLRDFL